MKITLITTGSRGDIQPYIPLARGFRNAGYDITIATHEPYRDFVTRKGVQFAPIAGDPRQILEGDSGLDWIDTGGNPLTSMTRMRDIVMPRAMEMARTIIEASKGSDALLYSSLAFFAGQSLMEKYHIPGMGVNLQPIHPTKTYPFFMFPELPLGRNYNKLTYHLINNITGLLFQTLVNEIRKEFLDLPPYNNNFNNFMNRPYPAVYGYSPSVIPQPPDWGVHLKVTGYWFLDEDYEPPPDLVDWLDSGEKPVYVGFGSMTNRNPAETTEIVLKAVKQTGVRCILLTGWAGIGNADTADDIFVIDNVPHHWLFPKMQAVVHHGGAGTTSAGLRAGVPSIIVPHFVDQPFWGRKVAKLGVGTQPIPREQLSVETLSRAIKRAIYDKPMQARAKELGERIRAENGVKSAVRFFEDYVLTHPPVV